MKVHIADSANTPGICDSKIIAQRAQKPLKKAKKEDPLESGSLLYWDVL
jgi:hypothetical protein